MIRALCALVILLAPPAGTRVLEGAITAQDGAGRFVLLPEPPLAVGEDMFDSPDLIAFDEAQSVLLEADLIPDIGAPIPAGRLVALHHVIFDSTGGRQRGWVRFSGPILGLATQDATLSATDPLAGVGVLYLGHQMRGLEPGDRAWIDPADPTRLWVDWAGSSPGDHLRVITQGPPLI